MILIVLRPPWRGTGTPGRLSRVAARGSRRSWRRRPGRAAPAKLLRGRASGTRVGRPQREILLCGARRRLRGRSAVWLQSVLVGDRVTVLGTHTHPGVRGRIVGNRTAGPAGSAARRIRERRPSRPNAAAGTPTTRA